MRTDIPKSPVRDDKEEGLMRNTRLDTALFLLPCTKKKILAIARAHVHARGGNALVGFRIKDMDIIDNVHKDQAQCLLAIQGWEHSC